ncbi:MAG: aminodeoxychorismate lyase [Gammaproteobacteria bacterium]|nr:MAG: aminodeoxychorismate lyase [Gammaproteobacteria bacterium]
MRLVIRLIFLLFAIGLAAFAIGYRYVDVKMHTPLSLDSAFNIHLEKGQSVYHVARQLKQIHALDYIQPFVYYARYMNVANKIQAGEYHFQPDVTPNYILQQLVTGNVIQYSVTLVEGLKTGELIAHLQANTQLERNDRVQVLLSDSAKLMAELGAAGMHPEGQFFPDTYFFTKGETAYDILKRAFDRKQQILAEEWQSREQGLPYKTPYQALIMASIVEKETGVDSERSEIAGVFVRRLRKGMRLQTDPTVIYGLGDQYQGDIKRSHLKQKTAYNTYTIQGLPPTPIANVGREAIHAALHPAKGKKLYFVARGDGSHVFSETLEAHNKAVREYQLRRRADYRSAPKQ